MIDWKHLATTTGYKSLKEAYISDVQNKHRSKKESLRKFQWVINRAKHYAHHTGKSMEAILNEWEAKRDYWWLNYYQSGRQPKFHSDSTKTMGLRGMIKYCKNSYRHDHARRRLRIIELKRTLREKKTKPRWGMRRKKRGY